MRPQHLLSGIVLLCLLIPFASFSQPLRILSYNIRYDNPGDVGNLWEDRKTLIASVIQEYQPDIIGFQEALLHQIQDLESQLPEYTWVGVGREDGHKQGEFVPIFYRTERLELIQPNHFWLSEMPNLAGSKSWDSACPRMVTYGSFKDMASGKTFYLFNTHFDHYSQQARENSAVLLLRKALNVSRDEPFFVIGDFNDRPDSDTYKTLCMELADTRTLSPNPPYSAEFTYKAFDKPAKAGQVIDYVFAKTANGQLRVLRHQILEENHNGKYPSDHMPVLVEVEIQ